MGGVEGVGKGMCWRKEVGGRKGRKGRFGGLRRKFGGVERSKDVRKENGVDNKK
jgi:hypothetical protein